MAEAYIYPSRRSFLRHAKQGHMLMGGTEDTWKAVLRQEQLIERNRRKNEARHG